MPTDVEERIRSGNAGSAQLTDNYNRLYDEYHGLKNDRFIERFIYWELPIPYILGQTTEYYLISSKNILIIRDKQQELIKESTLEASDLDTKTLRQISFGIRAALVVGGELSVGLVYNPNNPWDSGVLLEGGIGAGWEVGIETPLGPVVENIASSLVSSIDFTNPTHTRDLEGLSPKYTVSVVGGASFDGESVTGLELGSIGGGAYLTGTTVWTVGEIAESVYNGIGFFVNHLFSTPWAPQPMTRIELDGKW